MSDVRPARAVNDVPAWALALLAEGRVARLGTSDRAARPLVVPVCYAFDGRRIYSAVDAKPKRTRALRRLQNIRANPRVSLCVDRWDEDWRRLRWVIVEGRASVIEDGEEVAAAADLLLEKYPQYRTLGLDRRSATMIRVVPDRVLSWRFA